MYSHAKQHYLVLDAARGIAALAVVFFHLRKAIYPDVTFGWAQGLFERSYLAVDLFFLISGLVVAEAYERKLHDGLMTFGGFVWTRLLRLYPLYALGTIVGFCHALAKSGVGAPAIIAGPVLTPKPGLLAANMLFLPSLGERIFGLFPYDPATWSLELEWAANLIYALWAARQKTATLGIITVVAAVGLVPCTVANGSLDMGWDLPTMAGGSLRIGFSYTCGVLIYRLRAECWRPNVKIGPVPLLAVLALAVATPFAQQSAFYDLLCALVVFPLFVVMACESEAPLILRRTFVELGRLSYAIYVLHHPIIVWSSSLWKAVAMRDLEAAPLITLPLLLLIILVGSYLAAVAFDEPIRRVLSRCFRRELPSTDASSSRHAASGGSGGAFL